MAKVVQLLKTLNGLCHSSGFFFFFDTISSRMISHIAFIGQMIGFVELSFAQVAHSHSCPAL